MIKPIILIMICLASSQHLQAQIYDPFHKTSKPRVSSVSGLLPPPSLIVQLPSITQTIVSAVMNNKAFINGAWYHVGDRVNNQEVAYIQNNFVGLKENNRLTMIAVGGAHRLFHTKEIP